MEIRFNVTGAERKALVVAVSGITGCDAVYMKAPSFAYTVGDYTIDKCAYPISTGENHSLSVL